MINLSGYDLETLRVRRCLFFYLFFITTSIRLDLLCRRESQLEATVYILTFKSTLFHFDLIHATDTITKAISFNQPWPLMRYMVFH